MENDLRFIITTWKSWVDTYTQSDSQQQHIFSLGFRTKGQSLGGAFDLIGISAEQRLRQNDFQSDLEIEQLKVKSKR